MENTVKYKKKILLTDGVPFDIVKSILVIRVVIIITVGVDICIYCFFSGHLK